MQDTNIREDGCDLFSTSDSSSSTTEETTDSSTLSANTDYEKYITKNGTNFYTIFSTIRVCYGNLQQ